MLKSTVQKHIGRKWRIPNVIHIVSKLEFSRFAKNIFYFHSGGADGKLIEWEKVGSDTSTIGQHISTKALGSFKREDITERYKYPEGED